MTDLTDIEAMIRNKARDVAKDGRRYEKTLTTLLKTIREARRTGISDLRVAELMFEGTSLPEDRAHIQGVVDRLNSILPQQEPEN